MGDNGVFITQSLITQILNYRMIQNSCINLSSVSTEYDDWEKVCLLIVVLRPKNI